MHDQAVLIGRFQPFHNEHLHLLEKTLEEAHHVTILLGSFNAAPNFRNPWTCQERHRFINSVLKESWKPRISFEYIRDYLYSDSTWISQVQNKVARRGQLVRELVKKNDINICLSGSKKDGSSFYLDFFPAWRRTGPEISSHPLNATDIRESFFAGYDGWEDDVPVTIANEMKLWKAENPERFEALAIEQRFIEKYKNDWAGSPYSPIFVTVDAVVICGGHVLVVKRGCQPGKGLYALPGGFLEQGESIKTAVVRELHEETGLLLPREDIVNSMRESKVFDHPLRSLRGRTITHAQLFVINGDEIPRIKAGDDAADAEWMSLSDLQENESKFFEDHFHIINHFVQRL